MYIDVKIVEHYSWSRCAEVRVRQARAAARRVSLVMVEWWECGDWWRLGEADNILSWCTLCLF